MTPPAVAAVWIGAGLLGATALPALRLRRAAVIVPVAAFVAVMFAVLAPAPAVPLAESGAGFNLDRTSQGMLALTAGATALYLLTVGRVRGPELGLAGIAGAAAAIALSAQHPLVWGAALLVAMAALALRWIAVAPGRATLVAGRAPVLGAGALLAVAAFTPLTTAALDPRPALVGALAAVGLGAIIGLLPLGGWAVTALEALPPAEAAAWPLIIAPAALLCVVRAAGGLPPVGLSVFGHLLLIGGLSTAAWHGVLAVIRPSGRYHRVLLADLGLAAATVGSGLPGLALTIVLLGTLTHLVCAPLLLAEGRLPHRVRVLSWLLLSGVPPAPSFWFRLLAVQAAAAVGPQATIPLLGAWAAITLAVLLAVRSPDSGTDPDTTLPPLWLTTPVYVLLLAAGLAVGLAPTGALRLVFGGG
jgi:hypothetical protein